MGWWRAILRLGLILGAGLSTLACGPSTPTPPIALTPAPPPRLSVTPSPAPLPPAIVATPAATQVPTPTLRIFEGWLPGPALISAVQEPTDIQLTLRTMTQLQGRLRSLAFGQPTGEDLVDVTQQLAALMTQVQAQISRMTPTQRQQALQLEQELVSGIGFVQSSYIYHGNSTGPTTAPGTAVTVPGTPLTVIGTPVPVSLSSLPSPGQLLAHDVAQLQLNAAEMAKGHPDDGNITGWLESAVAGLSIIRQLAPQLSPPALQQLATGMAEAMTAMIGAMQAYVSG